VARYLFYPAADAAQDQIWRYTVETWGRRQAEKYIRGLHAFLAKLAETRALWRPLPRSLVVPADLKLDAWFARYEHHYVFFRELPEGIGIISILHERMDLPVRLADDLQKLHMLNEPEAD
jgi:plasmid stabilization system protein ParE